MALIVYLSSVCWQHGFFFLSGAHCYFDSNVFARITTLMVLRLKYLVIWTKKTVTTTPKIDERQLIPQIPATLMLVLRKPVTLKAKNKYGLSPSFGKTSQFKQRYFKQLF